jgi:predicted nuclease with RNAse H fold
MELVAGIDVGGTRKGSHLALVDATARMVEPVLHVMSAAAAVRHLMELGVEVVAIDAPRRPAPDGQRSRACERALRRTTGHGIFWTPDAAQLSGHYLRDWLQTGFEFFEQAAAAGLRAEEAFPSASFSLLSARRAGETRTTHTTRVTDHVRGRLGCDAHAVGGQDARDALCAAWIARAIHTGTAQFSEGDSGDTDRIAWIDTVDGAPIDA